MPMGSRATSGTRPWPPNMKRFFAAWLTISSIAHSAKSMTRISTTGRRPASAMPTAAPMMLASRWRVDHARRAEALLQAAVLAEHTATAQVFAQRHHALVGRHRGFQRPLRGLGIRQVAARNSSPHPAPVFITSS